MNKGGHLKNGHKVRSYISPKRYAFYVLFGLILGLALFMSLITWIAAGIPAVAVAAAFPCGLVSILGFVFMGLTQRTATRKAMSWKRALWYVLAVGFILFGVFVAAIAYLAVAYDTVYATFQLVDSASVLTAIITLMLFVLPGGALLIFLILTEKGRRKLCPHDEAE